MINKWHYHRWLINDNKYRLSIRSTGLKDGDGKYICEYKFARNNVVIFSGRDFHCSPLHSPTSFDSMLALMSFLTLRPGDTDKEYFDDYTPEQLDFANSFDNETLQAVIIR